MRTDLRHADVMEEQGFTIDQHCYPWVAYKGARFRPDEWYSCYTVLESMYARELELLHRGFYLRDDTELRKDDPHYEGFEEAYSLCTNNPFTRYHVFAGSRPWAVRQAYDYVNDPNHSKPSNDTSDE